MESLNSVLLEGIVITEPMMDTETGVCSFRIRPNRTILAQDGTRQKIEEEFLIEARGRSAKSCMSFCPCGVKARITGRLARDKISGEVVIAGDSFQFSPLSIQE